MKDRDDSGRETVAGTRQPRLASPQSEPNPPPQALLPVTLDPYLSTHSSRSRIDNTMRLGTSTTGLQED